MSRTRSDDGPLAGRVVDDATLDEWIAAFDRDGYLYIEDVLPQDWMDELKRDLHEALDADGQAESLHPTIRIHKRMFERSRANLRLFDLEPIVSFAERLIGRDDPTFGTDGVHVIHNSAFLTLPDSPITPWHQDDGPHYIVTDGEPPSNVRLPVLAVMASYHLNDLPSGEYGPTELLPGSHRFGGIPPKTLDGTPWEGGTVTVTARAGSVLLFNNQIWHHGGRNTSDADRYLNQLTYARRLVGHKYEPFMNYELPPHVLEGASPRLRRLLGFIPSGGPYG